MTKHIRVFPGLLATLTLLWCLFVGWYVWTTPVRYVGLAPDPQDPERVVQAEKYEPFSNVSAGGALPLGIPVVLAGLATAAAWAHLPVAVGLLGLTLLAFGFVTGFSIGSAYIPAGGVLILAAGIDAACRPGSEM